MKQLKTGTVIETKKGIYIILERDKSLESYMCIKTKYKDCTDMEFEEILNEEILGYMNAQF